MTHVRVARPSPRVLGSSAVTIYAEMDGWDGSGSGSWILEGSPQSICGMSLASGDAAEMLETVDRGTLKDLVLCDMEVPLGGFYGASTLKKECLIWI